MKPCYGKTRWACLEGPRRWGNRGEYYATNIYLPVLEVGQRKGYELRGLPHDLPGRRYQAGIHGPVLRQPGQFAQVHMSYEELRSELVHEAT